MRHMLSMNEIDIKLRVYTLMLSTHYFGLKNSGLEMCTVVFPLSVDS